MLILRAELCKILNAMKIADSLFAFTLGWISLNLEQTLKDVCDLETQ